MLGARACSTCTNILQHRLVCQRALVLAVSLMQLLHFLQLFGGARCFRKVRYHAAMLAAWAVVQQPREQHTLQSFIQPRVLFRFLCLLINGTSCWLCWLWSLGARDNVTPPPPRVTLIGVGMHALFVFVCLQPTTTGGCLQCFVVALVCIVTSGIATRC